MEVGARHTYFTYTKSMSSQRHLQPILMETNILMEYLPLEVVFYEGKEHRQDTERKSTTPSEMDGPCVSRCFAILVMTAIVIHSQCRVIKLYLHQKA